MWFHRVYKDHKHLEVERPGDKILSPVEMFEKAQDNSKYILCSLTFLIIEFPKSLILQYTMFGLLWKAELYIHFFFEENTLPWVSFVSPFRTT